MKIKVCGMKDPDNLAQVCRLEPDLVGYIFYRESKRYIGDKPDPALFHIPGKNIGRVGVFVNEPLGSILEIAGSGHLDMVQLHGEESPAYCRSLVEQGIPVMKSLPPSALKNTDSIRAYSNLVHYFLFDSAGDRVGGTGLKFDWKLLDQYALPVPFFLSGGIGPGDSASILNLEQDRLIGLDLNSRFESRPGYKEVQLLEPFIKAIRQ